MTEYAWQNAKSFLYPKETVLDDEYPVFAGYAYIAIYEDGEVLVVSADQNGYVASLKNQAAEQRHKPVAEIRRCNIMARTLDKGAASA